MPRVLILLTLACYQPPGPAPGGSASALLASQVAEIGRRTELLAAHSREIDGAADAWRAATPERRAVLEGQLRERALHLQAEAAALRAQVNDVEEQARVWDP